MILGRNQQRVGTKSWFLPQQKKTKKCPSKLRGEAALVLMRANTLIFGRVADVGITAIDNEFEYTGTRHALWSARAVTTSACPPAAAINSGVWCLLPKTKHLKSQRPCTFTTQSHWPCKFTTHSHWPCTFTTQSHWPCTFTTQSQRPCTFTS